MSDDAVILAACAIVLTIIGATNALIRAIEALTTAVRWAVPKEINVFHKAPREPWQDN